MMGKTEVKQPLPASRLEQISPFLLLHHFGGTAEPGHDPLGVGPHPHRGFEPVTFLFKGGIKHRDSRGNTGLLAAGDVQWMTAGMGIIHSEYASPDFLEKGGEMEGIQLWVNLARKDKMVQPRYQDIKKDTIPKVNPTKGEGHVAIVAGELNGLTGAAKTYSPINAFMAVLEPGALIDIPLPESHNSFVYILDGEGELNAEKSVHGEQLIQFGLDGDGIQFKATSQTRLLIVSGAPIDEPLAQYGPFVMNNQTEIMEAMRDYQMGKMGVYIEE